MAIYSAVLDACVLVPIALADILLRTAEKQLFRPVWSERILAETRAALTVIHPKIDPKLFDRRIWHMNETFPDASVTNLDSIATGIALPDPNDNHVLAAAIRGQCNAIVTANLRDFPECYLNEFGIEAISPDDFLLNQLDLLARPVLDAVREQAVAASNPVLAVDELLVVLGRAGVPNFADEVLKRIQ